jgi:hypothetical protein
MTTMTPKKGMGNLTKPDILHAPSRRENMRFGGDMSTCLPASVDGVLDLYAAVARQAVKDYARGEQGSPKEQDDYRTARAWLEREDLLTLVHDRLGGAQ